MRERVVHVVVAGEVGGAERMLVELAARPDATGADHVVALMTPSDRLRATFVRAGLRIHDRGMVREGPVATIVRALGPGDVAWLEGVMREERATVAHVHTFGSQVVGTRAAMRARVPVVRTDHSTRAYDDPTCWPFSRWALARADAVGGGSERVRRGALGRAPWVAGRSRVVLPGVDVTRFTPGPRATCGAARFAVVARLERRKAVDLAVRAVRRVAERRST